MGVKNQKPILLLDDERSIVELLAGNLRDGGYQVVVTQNSDDLPGLLTTHQPALLLLDIWLQGSRLQGFDVLARLRQTHPQLPVIIISGHGNIETAVAAIKAGASDFIEKPFRMEHLLNAVRRTLNDTDSDRALYSGSLRSARARFEHRYFGLLLEQMQGNVARAAEHAGMERTALHRKLKQFGLTSARQKRSDARRSDAKRNDTKCSDTKRSHA